MCAGAHLGNSPALNPRQSSALALEFAVPLLLWRFDAVPPSPRKRAANGLVFKLRAVPSANLAALRRGFPAPRWFSSYAASSASEMPCPTPMHMVQRARLAPRS
jgi:hypothetical protein